LAASAHSLAASGACSDVDKAETWDQPGSLMTVPAQSAYETVGLCSARCGAWRDVVRKRVSGFCTAVAFRPTS